MNRVAGMVFLLSGLISVGVLAESSLPDVRTHITQQGLSWTAGETSVSQLSDAEFQNLLGTRAPKDYRPPEPKPRHQPLSLPDRFDWREMGGVTPVDNQGQCGSCWAFSALHAFESQFLIEEGWAGDFSEQQLVSCDGGNSGCSGGWFTTAWEFLGSPGSILEQCMPYEADDSVPCTMWDCDFYSSTTDYGYIDNSVEGIKQELLNGPVAVAMYVYSDLKYYTDGCYEHEHSGTSVNHGVVIVGWDDSVCDSGAWIVKNSWGTGWGMDGYGYFKYNTSNVGYGAAYVRQAAVSPVRPEYDEHTIIDDDNGVPEPGETVTLQMDLYNRGREAATAVSATLTTSSPDITLETAVAVFPDLPPKGSASSEDPHFRFTVDAAAEPGTLVAFELEIVTAEGSFTDAFRDFIGPQESVFFDDFETSDDNGWTHGVIRRSDDWERGIAGEEATLDPHEAYSGEKLWGNALSGWGRYRNNCANYLESPPVPCWEYEKVYLRFQRWLTVEQGKYDQAIITVNDQEIWRNPYEGHITDYYWHDMLYDISEYADHTPFVRLRFELYTDEGLTFGGWNIDDVELIGVRLDNPGLSPTPTPTQVPTITPTPPASPTPTEIPFSFGIALHLNNTMFESGDTFLLEYEWGNPRESVLVQEYIVLDVFGSYWFWPGWTQALDYRERELPAATTDRENILDFVWPEGAGAADGILFWSAMMYPAGGLIELVQVEWGYR